MSFIATLKEGVRFTLRSKDYKGLITALSEGNNALRILVSQSKDLEPFRQHRARTENIRIAQQQTEGIYTSLCASVNCKCASSHGFGLELPSRQGFSRGFGAWGTNNARFGIAFGSNRAKSTEHWDQVRASLTSNTWYSCLPRRPSIPPMTGVPFPGSESSASYRMLARGVVPIIPNSALRSTTSTMTCQEVSATHDSGSEAEAHNNISQIEDLCDEFAKEKKISKERCFGFITYQKNQFYLSHQSGNPTGYTLITLKEILSGNNSQLPRLDYSQKAKIAHTLSSNLLSLVTTSWLEKVLHLNGIAFFRFDDGPNGWVYLLDRVYLPKSLATSPSTAKLSCGHSTYLPATKYKPLTILSLACLLVQVILGHSMDDFDIAERSCLKCLMTQQAAASRKLGAVLAKGGDMYADAVSWCLENYLSAVNLDDGEFNHRYHSTVVAKLEALVDIVGSFSAS